MVITGASAGLGRAIACEFAKHGARIGLLARGRKGLEGAAADVTRRAASSDSGGRRSDADAVEKAAAAVEEQFGPIDVWVNNAMVSVFSPVREMSRQNTSA